MVNSYRTVTKEEFLKALEDNGYRKARHDLVRGTYTAKGVTIAAACALGQAALNLGVSAYTLSSALTNIRVEVTEQDRPLSPRYNTNLTSFIAGRNDGTSDTPKQIVAKLKKKVINWPKNGLRVIKVSYDEYINYRGITVPEKEG